jgi:2-dehydro-3-deoxygalactonokinase
MPQIRPDWIAVDWGTTNVRAWAMTDAGDVLGALNSTDGMCKLSRDEFEPALAKLLAPWMTDAPVDVLACGMLGSLQGWVEAPYRATPCAALASETVQAPSVDPRFSVRVVPGVRQNKPADVMRGEETQIAGYLAKNPKFDGVLCLPGTHTKWVHISAGEIVSFQTFLTGEMFAALSTHTVLRHSIDPIGWDDAAFDDALADALSRPDRLAARLFTVRAEGVLNGQSGGVARARLSGALIGAELAAAKPYWLGQQIVVIGASFLARIYMRALEAQGGAPHFADAAEMTIDGLTAVRQNAKAGP